MCLTSPCTCFKVMQFNFPSHNYVQITYCTIIPFLVRYVSALSDWFMEQVATSSIFVTFFVLLSISLTKYIVVKVCNSTQLLFPKSFSHHALPVAIFQWKCLWKKIYTCKKNRTNKWLTLSSNKTKPCLKHSGLFLN